MLRQLNRDAEEAKLGAELEELYAIEDEVMFQLTEKGWKCDSWNRKRFRRCAAA